MASYSSFCSKPESVLCEGPEFFLEFNNMLLMTLTEETQEDQYCEDDRLISMIQSLEAEISSSTSVEVGHVDSQDCSTSSISFWEDIEVVSASSSPSAPTSSFDEDMMDAWSLCTGGGDDDSNDYFCCDSSEFHYGILLENYLPQEASDDIVF